MKPTSRIRESIKRAGNRDRASKVYDPIRRVDKERLFAGLEWFVNVGDALEAYEEFSRQCPTFFPVDLIDDSQQSATPQTGWRDCAVYGDKSLWVKSLSWEPSCHLLFLHYRNAVRRLWSGSDTDSVLSRNLEMCLELDPEIANLMWDEEIFKLTNPGPWTEVESTSPYSSLEIEQPELREACLAVKKAFPEASILQDWHYRPILFNWRTGDFSYLPRNDFQRAVYLLFRESWRARNCKECGRHFIAQKAASRYCSVDCWQAFKQKRDNQYWSDRGKMRRVKRLRNASSPKSRRKRGI